MRPSEIINVLEKSFSNGHRTPVLLVGAPGVGKTDLVRQAAKACDMKLIISHPVVSDPTDYKGLPGIVDGKAEFLPYGDLRQLCEATEPTIFFADDLGQAPVAVQAAMMQLLLSRSVNGKQVADCVQFVAASNRRQDKAGVNGILEPVKSRFATIINLNVDLDDWCVWAFDNGIRPEVIAFLRMKPQLLHDFKPSSDFVQSPCPRTWMFVSRLLDMGLDDVEIIAGAVGEGAAVEFMAFYRMAKRVISPDVILLDPDNADVPTNADALYTVCTALATRSTDKTGSRIVKYANRLPDDFSVLLVRDAIRKCKETANCNEFVMWSAKHKDVLL